MKTTLKRHLSKIIFPAIISLTSCSSNQSTTPPPAPNTQPQPSTSRPVGLVNWADPDDTAERNRVRNRNHENYSGKLPDIPEGATSVEELKRIFAEQADKNIEADLQRASSKGR